MREEDPVADIGKLVKEAGALYLVDCVTSMGGIEVEMDKWRIDALYSGTQKCLSCPPEPMKLQLQGQNQDILTADNIHVQNSITPCHPKIEEYQSHSEGSPSTCSVEEQITAKDHSTHVVQGCGRPTCPGIKVITSPNPPVPLMQPASSSFTGEGYAHNPLTTDDHHVKFPMGNPQQFLPDIGTRLCFLPHNRESFHNTFLYYS